MRIHPRRGNIVLSTVHGRLHGTNKSSQHLFHGSDAPSPVWIISQWGQIFRVKRRAGVKWLEERLVPCVLEDDPDFYLLFWWMYRGWWMLTIRCRGGGTFVLFNWKGGGESVTNISRGLWKLCVNVEWILLLWKMIRYSISRYFNRLRSLVFKFLFNVYCVYNKYR